MPNRLAGTVLFLVVAVFASACVTAPRKGTATADASLAPCGQRAEDSVYAHSAPIYRDCSVQNPVRQIPSNVRPDFTPEVAGNQCYTAEVEFVVSAAGELELGTVRVIHTNSQPFAQSVVNVLPRWKYDPAMLNGVAVRQIINLTQRMQTGSVVVARVAQGSGLPPVSRPPRGSTTPKC